METWKFKSSDFDPKKSPPGLNLLVAELLHNRGISAPEQTERFLNPKYENLYDPFIFKDMAKACKRIWQAIEADEKILIYADYDADAVTAAAVLGRSFKKLKAQFEVYIPDRFSEGYGLNLAAFQKFADQNFKLIVTVDCGTNALPEAEFCLEQGIDLIITDHHILTGPAPAAYCLINPKYSEENYPDHEITGVGVAFKLAQALFSDLPKVRRRDPEYVVGFEKWLLDLVAIGTIADVHSLTDENRIFVSFGLKVLSKTRWGGLLCLLLDLKPKLIDEIFIAFSIAPQINAAGRLKHASLALDLLLTDNPDEARSLAASISALNSKRKTMTELIISEAREQALTQLSRKVFVFAESHWHRGLVGIVAGRLSNEFRRPVVILEKGEVESIGSLRAPAGFDSVAALSYLQSFLVRFGGHKGAAGLTVKSHELENFYKNFLEYVNKAEIFDEAEQEVSGSVMGEIEARLQPADLNLEVFRQILSLRPFGAGNPSPIFLLEGAELSSFRVVGNGAKHLQVSLLAGNTKIDGIAFNKGYLANQLVIGAKLDLVAEVLIDSWQGAEKPKLKILDIGP